MEKKKVAKRVGTEACPPSPKQTGVEKERLPPIGRPWQEGSAPSDEGQKEKEESGFFDKVSEGLFAGRARQLLALLGRLGRCDVGRPTGSGRQPHGQWLGLL